MQLIGLSMSKCVAQILGKTVNERDVIAIVAGTRFLNVQQAMDHYYKAKWAEFATYEEAQTLLRRMWERIVQPRESGEEFTPFIYRGIWLSTDQAMQHPSSKPKENVA